MRIKAPNTILYYQFVNRDKIIRTRHFVDNCNFKSFYQENDQIELNVQNKLFILTGKKFNQFFCYDFDRNEIQRLAELKNCHFYGSFIYVPFNNSIYCLGGNNSKKCEIYRNDEIIFSEYTNEIKLHVKNNQWVEIAEMNYARQEFSVILFNSYIYAFFGFNNPSNYNTPTIEIISVVTNQKWEVVNYSNSYLLNLNLSSHASLILNDKEILILGGFDGKNYSDKLLKYNLVANSASSYDFKIPFLKKNSYYNFFKEGAFIHIRDFASVIDENCFNYALFDNKNRLHLTNSRKNLYDVISYNNID